MLAAVKYDAIKYDFLSLSSAHMISFLTFWLHVRKTSFKPFDNNKNKSKFKTRLNQLLILILRNPDAKLFTTTLCIVAACRNPLKRPTTLLVIAKFLAASFLLSPLIAARAVKQTSNRLVVNRVLGDTRGHVETLALLVMSFALNCDRLRNEFCRSSLTVSECVAIV